METRFWSSHLVSGRTIITSITDSTQHPPTPRFNSFRFWTSATILKVLFVFWPALSFLSNHYFSSQEIMRLSDRVANILYSEGSLWIHRLPESGGVLIQCWHQALLLPPHRHSLFGNTPTLGGDGVMKKYQINCIPPI